LILKGVKKPARARGEFPGIFQAVLQSPLLASRFAHPTNGTHSACGDAVWVYQSANAVDIMSVARIQGSNIRSRTRLAVNIHAYTCADAPRISNLRPAIER
jgi:hypothetical protein